MADSNMCSAMAETEVATLKEALHAQHQLMQKLCIELEEEREASASAVSEALSMILRLQEEKAAEKMEANQYKRMIEEKMHHTEESLTVFEELYYRKEMELASLFFQLEAYKYKMLSMGFTDLDFGEMEFYKKLPLHKGDSHLDDMGICGTVGQGVAVPLKCCKGSNSNEHCVERNSKEQCVERGPTYSTKRKIHGGTSQEFYPEIGSKNHGNRLIDNENLSQIHDEMQNMYTGSAFEDCSSYWERIEQMDKRVKELSHCNSVDGGIKSELVLANKELEATIAAYSASLQAGSRTYSRHSATSNEPLDSTTGKGIELDTSHSFSCASSEAEDIENLSDYDACSMPCTETEMNGNTIPCMSVHDIYEVPQNPDSCQFCDPQKQVAQTCILKGEKRLEKMDLVQQETVKYYSKDESQWIKKALLCAHHEKLSALTMDVKNGGDLVDVDTKSVVVSSQVEVQQLHKRLQLLEDDTRIMKQEASEKREEETMMLKAICEQLKAMQSQISHPKAHKHSPRDESLLISAMEAMLSFSI